MYVHTYTLHVYVKLINQLLLASISSLFRLRCFTLLVIVLVFIATISFAAAYTCEHFAIY